MLEKEFWYDVNKGTSLLHLAIGHHLMSYMSTNLKNTYGYGCLTIIII